MDNNRFILVIISLENEGRVYVPPHFRITYRHTMHCRVPSQILAVACTVIGHRNDDGVWREQEAQLPQR